MTEASDSGVRWSRVFRSAVVGGVISSLIASLGFYLSDYRHLGDVGSWNGIAAISAWGAFLGVGRETTLETAGTDPLLRSVGNNRYWGRHAAPGWAVFVGCLGARKVVVAGIAADHTYPGTGARNRSWLVDAVLGARAVTGFVTPEAVNGTCGI